MAVLRMYNEKYSIWPLFVAESPKFPRLKGNRGLEHDGDVRFLTGSHGLVNSAMGRYRVPQNVFLVINTTH